MWGGGGVAASVFISEMIKKLSESYKNCNVRVASFSKNGIPNMIQKNPAQKFPIQNEIYLNILKINVFLFVRERANVSAVFV
jgi:hypothetical protein